MTCRHRTSWILAGGYIEWCYACGAWRGMLPIGGSNRITATSPWCRPVGPDKPNPWFKFDRAKKAYAKRQSR